MNTFGEPALRLTLVSIIFQVQIDGSDDVSSISTGNQVHKRQNYKDIFQLRFPKFDSEILYDPYISAGGAYGKKWVTTKSWTK